MILLIGKSQGEIKMSWFTILKADWEFIKNPDATWYGEYNSEEDIITINLSAFGRLMREVIEYVREEELDRGLFSGLGVDDILNSPVGSHFENILVDRLIETMQHESIHEAHHITSLKEEVKNIFNKKEYHNLLVEMFAELNLPEEMGRQVTGETLWSKLISKFYDEFFVRIQLGTTYETALRDTIEYIKDWTEKLIEVAQQAIQETGLNALGARASMNITTTQAEMIIERFTDVYEKIGEWMIDRNNRLNEKLLEMKETFGDDIEEYIDSLSEEERIEVGRKWKSKLKPLSHLTEAWQEKYSRFPGDEE